MKPLIFGEWLPDQPSFASKGLLTASNCYPRAPFGYRPVGAFAQVVPAGTEPFLGAASFTSPQGVITIVGGSATTLYRVFSGEWASLATGYNLQSGDRWRFAQFGGLAIATNGRDPMQKVDLTTGTTANLGGSPPKARMLAVVKDFLVAGVIDGQTNAIAWSAINNAEKWVYGQAQSDYNIMPSGGDVNGLFGGEFGLILQRSRITRMEYVGGNEIFVINEISSNFGCATSNSVVQHGMMGWFLSDNGFMMWDGASLSQIGNEKIDRYFLSNYSKASWQDMSAAVDVPNQVAVWSMGDRMFCYHWTTNRWTTIELAAQIVFSGVTRTLSIDETDPAVGAPDDDLDTPGLLPLDDASFKGGDSTFYVIDSDNVLGTLSGTPMAASWELPDMELARSRETQLRFVRPDTDATSGLTLSIACRARLGDPVVETNYTDLGLNGDMPVRERGRYVRMGLSLAAGTDWTYAQALEPDGVAGAVR